VIDLIFLLAPGMGMLLEKAAVWIDNAIKVIENTKRASLKEMTCSILI
jgi:hypothetical protein